MAETKVHKSQHEVIESMYRGGKTLAYIGDRYHLTRERVRQILKARGVTRSDSIRPNQKTLLDEYKERRKAIAAQREKDSIDRIYTSAYYAREMLSGKRSAGYEVAKAIKSGQLLHPTNYCCIDCGCKATEYDHRDYNIPLNVDPVCRGCNARRGQAKPVNGFIARMVELGHPPFAYRLHMQRLAKIYGYEIQGLHLLPKRLTAAHWANAWPELKAAA